MKNFFTRAGFLLILLFSFSAKAQNEVDLFIGDMLKIADDFATPAAEGASYLSGAGWFSSAKELELWQVDLSVHANVLFVPQARKTSTVSNDDYATLNIRGAENAEIPTAFGEATDVVFEGEIFDQEFDFDAIDGINKKILAHPFLQASVGLPFGTDFSARFLPKTTIDDVGFSTFGVGLKHNFNQYFRNSQPTDFQFAALLAYSRYDVNYAFSPVSVEYEILGIERVAIALDEIEVDADLWLFELVSSKSFFNSGWEVFGAVGATNSNFAYAAGGGGDFLGQMNSALETLSSNEIEFKGDLGFNYSAGNFRLSSMLSAGKFVNYNLGLHYRL